MPLQAITIRALTPQGPAELGPVLAVCPVLRIVTDYAYPAIDVQMPGEWVLPEKPIDVALYADGRYFGSLVLDSAGFHSHPDYPCTSPYFTVAVR